MIGAVLLSAFPIDPVRSALGWPVRRYPWIQDLGMAHHLLGIALALVIAGLFAWSTVGDADQENRIYSIAVTLAVAFVLGTLAYQIWRVGPGAFTVF